MSQPLGNQVNNNQQHPVPIHDASPPLQMQQQPEAAAMPVQPQVPVQQQQHQEVPPLAEKKPIDPGYGI